MNIYEEFEDVTSLTSLLDNEVYKVTFKTKDHKSKYCRSILSCKCAYLEKCSEIIEYPIIVY